MPIKRETSGRQPCKVLKSIAAGVSRSHEDPIPACLGIAILSLSALPAAAEIASVRVAGGEVRGVAAGAVTSFMGIPSPPAHGLFRGVISESGGSLAPPRFADEGGQNAPSLAAAEKQGKEFLEGLGAKDIAAGRALSADRLQKAAGPGLGRIWPAFDPPQRQGRVSRHLLRLAHLVVGASAVAPRDRPEAGPGKPGLRYYFDHRNAAMPDGSTHGSEMTYVFRNSGSAPDG
jgi:hypothetical protein